MFAQSSPCQSGNPDISRVVRLSSLAARLTPQQGKRILERLDLCASFAIVVLASSSVACAAVWMVERWQLS